MSKRQITTHFDAYGHEQTAEREDGKFSRKSRSGSAGAVDLGGIEPEGRFTAKLRNGDEVEAQRIGPELQGADGRIYRLAVVRQPWPPSEGDAQARIGGIELVDDETGEAAGDQQVVIPGMRAPVTMGSGAVWLSLERGKPVGRPRYDIGSPRRKKPGEFYAEPVFLHDSKRGQEFEDALDRDFERLVDEDPELFEPMADEDAQESHLERMRRFPGALIGGNLESQIDDYVAAGGDREKAVEEALSLIREHLMKTGSAARS